MRVPLSVKAESARHIRQSGYHMSDDVALQEYWDSRVAPFLLIRYIEDDNTDYAPISHALHLA